MGLFSSSKKYVAYAASSPLFPVEDGLPDTLKAKILESNSSGATKSAAVQVTINTDQFARAKSMMRYATRFEDPEKTGGYVRGYPTSNMNLVTVNPGAVEAALTRAVGAYDSISATKTGAFNESFFLSLSVQAQWAEWDERDDPVTLPDGSTAPNPPEFERIAEYGDPQFIYDRGEYLLQPATAEFDGKYDATWTSDTGDYTLSLDVGEYISGTHIMVSYRIGERTHYWHYLVDSGADPVLESAIGASIKEAAFLPVAVLMQDKVWFDEDINGIETPDTDVAVTTNKLLKRFATSGTKIKEDFITQEEEDNASGDSDKSNAKKWDFFIHFAVHIDTNVRGSKEYLWYFFQELRDWSTETSDNYYDYLSGPNTAQPINELRITEAGDNGYNVAYRWSYIESKSYTGQEFLIDDPLADITPRPLKPKEIHSQIVQREKILQAEYQDIVDEFFGAGTPVGGYNDPEKTKDDDIGYHDFFVITKQRADDTGYDRMLVMGLSMEYTINTRTEPGEKVGYRYRYAQPRLFGLDEETKEFRIPLLWKSLKEVPTLHREEVVAEGLTATVFLVEVIKTKWYQSGFFKWLLIIIAIVLIVISIWFPMLIEGAILILGAALGGGGIAMFVAYVVVMFAVGYMIALGTSLMSPRMQMILVVVIIIAMIYTGQFQNLQSTFAALRSSPGWATATAMINAIGPIYNMGFSVYSQYTMGKYEDELRDLVKDQKERMQELEDAWDAFGPVPSYLDPLDLAKTYERAGSAETATEYYQRVLIANPGVLAYDLVYNFTDMAITLPDEPGQPSIIDGMMTDFEQQRGQ